MKSCIACGLEKPSKDFYACKFTKDGLRSVCKLCFRLYGQRRYAKNTDKMKIASKAWRKRNHKKVQRYKACYRKTHKDLVAQHQRKWIGRNLFKVMLNAAKQNSVRRGLPFNLTEQHLISLFKAQNNVCALSGLQFCSEKIPGKRNPFKMSLDRITPSLGYINGNVRLVLWALNAGLGDWGIEVYASIASAVLARKH